MSIIDQTMPAWFEIGTKEEPLSLRLRIHKELAPELEEDLSVDSEIFQAVGYPNDFNLDEFTDFGVNKAWGYGQVIQPEPQLTPFLCWDIEIPSKIIDLTSKEPKYNLQRLGNISLTLALLQHTLSAPNYCEITLSNPPKYCQLVIYDLRSGKGSYGGSLYIELSKDLTQWLKRLDLKVVEQIIESSNRVMCLAYDKMIEGNEGTEQEIMTQLTNVGGIHFSVPGNACGLDPEHPPSDNKGYVLHPHNVDGLTQQMTLLIAVANLCDLYRKHNN